MAISSACSCSSAATSSLDRGITASVRGPVCVKWSLADPPVDPLAQQIRVAHMPGVLLNQVYEHLAQHIPGLAHHVEAGFRRHELLRELDLRAPGAPRLRHHLRIGYGTVEVAVPIRLGAEVRLARPAGHPQPEPDLLDPGHVAHQ